MQVRVGLDLQPERLVDALRGLLRAAHRGGDDQLDPLPLQPPAEPAGLLPAALRQRVPVVRPRALGPVGLVGERLAVADEVQLHAAISFMNSSCSRVSPAISGWKEMTSMLACRAATTWPSTSASTSQRRPVLVDPRRADEHGADRAAVHAGDVEVGLERPDLAAERVAPAGVVGDVRGARGRA